jgi:hypothetical protein
MDMPMSDTSQHTALNERVRRAFVTTNSDLEANRAGHITASQHARLEEKRTSYLVNFFAGLGLAVLVSCALIASGSSTSKRSNPMVGMLAFLVILPVAGFAVASQVSPISEDLKTDHLNSAQGPIERRILWQRSSKKYQIIVDGQVLEVDANQYEAFVDGEPYIVYHAAQSKLALAAEHVAETSS